MILNIVTKVFFTFKVPMRRDQEHLHQHPTSLAPCRKTFEGQRDNLLFLSEAEFQMLWCQMDRFCSEGRWIGDVFIRLRDELLIQI